MEISIAFQTDKSASQYIALAKLVNQYDFDTVSVYCDAPYQPSYAPLLLMAPYIERAKLGAAAISPSRMHPIDIASQTALLADLAKGGIYIGIARGAWLDDHGIHELTPPVLAIREAIEVVQYMLSGKDGGYAGQIFQIASHVKATYPLPTEKIPVMIGTWGKKLSGVAGELADEVKIGGSANPDVIPVIADYIAAGEIRAGRAVGTVKVAIGAVTVVDADRNAARMAARRSVALYLPVVAGLDSTVTVDPELMQRIQAYVNQGEHDAAAGLISDDLLERFAFAGNPADIINHCERLFAAGASRIEFGTPHGLTNPETGIRLIGEQVIPALKRL